MLSGESCVRFLHDASSARSRNRMRQIVGKIVPSKSPLNRPLGYRGRKPGSTAARTASSTLVCQVEGNNF